jgi:hypothetical protein
MKKILPEKVTPQMRFILRLMILLTLGYWGLNVQAQHREEEGKCPGSSAGFATRFSELIRTENFEEMPALLHEWESLCGDVEPVFRAKVLLKIYQRTFPGELSDQNLLDQAIAFEIRENLPVGSERRQEYFELYPEFFGFVPPGHVFDIQTKQWARRLQPTTASGSFSYIFLQLFEGQTENFFSALKDGYFPDSKLSLDYNKKVAENLKLPEFNLAVNAGIWLPQGDIEILGPHPSIGVVLGAKTRNSYLDAVFEFRIGKTGNDVMITVRDTLVTTRNYQGGYAGIEYTRILARLQNGTLEAFAGAGYDIIDIVEDKRDPERITFGSPAIHMGMGYRFHFQNRTWLSIKPGFYFLSHKHSTGSSLAGNAVNLRFTFGFSENARKSENLKRLGIQQWW